MYKYEFQNQVLTLKEISKITGISDSTIRDRIKKWNWSVHKAATTPVVKHGRFSRTEKIVLFCDYCSKGFERSRYIHTLGFINCGPNKKTYCSRACSLKVNSPNPHTNKYQFKGQSITLKELTKIANLNKSTIRYRLKQGWAPEDASTLPLRSRNPNR